MFTHKKAAPGFPVAGRARLAQPRQILGIVECVEGPDRTRWQVRSAIGQEGIECKLLATDTQRHRISLLVRLASGASSPAHTHAGVEELHLLYGELWIDGRKLFPGDYNYGVPRAGDDRAWSETGCTCVLVTSTKDLLQ